MKRTELCSRLATLAPLVACVVLALGGIASAHGDLRGGEPKEGARLAKPPRHAYLNFTETPSNNSKLEVFDGCGDRVVTNLERFDLTLHANLARGEPGEWRVRYDVISSEDGHETKGSYTFTVRGTKDCSAPPSGNDDDEAQTAPGSEILVNDDSGFPVVPVVMGALVLIGGAFAVRVMSSRR